MFRLAQIGVLIFVFAVPEVSGAATNQVLTTATQVLSLTMEQATQRISISVTGVVTLSEPNWGGRFFVEDSTAGVFVDNTFTPAPVPGDLVQVSGISHPGGYAPIIFSPQWKKVGTASLPEARPISVERLMSGVEDGQRVEVTGVVRSVQAWGRQLALELTSGGYRFKAFPRVSAEVDPNSLVGAIVRVRGTAAASFNYNRQMVTVSMFVPQESDFVVERYPVADTSEESITPLNSTAQYRQNGSPEKRIHVKGIVTYQRAGKDIFLRDETGGLQVKSHETNTFAPGEIVEAVGFVDLERFLPVLQDANLIRGKKPGKSPVPQKVSMRDLLDGFHHADLISLEGKLLDRSSRSFQAANSKSNAPTEVILTLQNSNNLFTVEAPAKHFTGLAAIPIGSMLEVSGVCLLQTGETSAIETVRVLLPDAASIRILQQPSWWTAERLVMGLGILVVVSGLGALWTLMILRKNAALKFSIAAKIKAQEELQKTNDQLESRVEERTKQLYFEMSARKEVEVRADAILTERTRLAQELHDTLLQGFTGIGLKLDALTKGLPPSLADTKEQLQKILEQSDEYLGEARRSVWQLRSPFLEKPGDFPKALMKVSERALQGTGIPLHFTISGVACKPAAAIEDNLVRICEEVVTNAAKHAHPAQVEVNLEYTSKELRLRIRDNGCGFDPRGSEATKDGHFGLVGIRERVKALNGNLSLNSHPGHGTEIFVTVRLAPP